jgi:hypothetical protein
MKWRVIETKLFMERNVKTEQKGSKELGKDLEKYTRTRNSGGLQRQVELRNMTYTSYPPSIKFLALKLWDCRLQSPLDL